MTLSTSSRQRALLTFVLAAIVVCGALYLYQRNAGLNPTVFADEWYYSKMARLMPLAEALVPSYLYLWLFGASQSCGAGFLDCVRAGNIALYAGAVPFVYLIARHYASTWMALLVALLTLLAPLNIYTAYFMPEATYYFGFCVLSWVALTRTGWHWAMLAAVTGTILGVMTLIKVHALFLIPALCVYLVYLNWQQGQSWLLRGAASAALAGFLTIAIKFALGYVLAGDAGLSLWGPFYQGAVNSGGASARLALLGPAFVSGRGHLMAMTVLMAVPLAVLLHGVLTNLFRERGARLNPLQMYTILMLGAAAGMTVIYTATLAHLPGNEGVRLHMRYYSFVFPLVWIVAAATATTRSPGEGMTRLRWLAAILVGIVLALAAMLLPGYWANMVDGPDIGGIPLPSFEGWIVIGVQAVLLLLWAVRAHIGAALFVAIGLPVALAVTQQNVFSYLAAHAPPGAGDRAGRLVHDTVPAAERGKVVVVGDDMTQIMRVQFHIDDPDSMPLLIEKDKVITEDQLPVNQKWMLVLGQYALPASPTVVHQDPQFTLLRLPEPDPVIAHIPMSAPFDPAILASVEGLSYAESWGRWSDSKQVVLQFAQPLPRTFNLILKARAYDINTEHPFKVTAGNSQEVKEFRAGWQMLPTRLHFETDGTVQRITIEVPHPVAPSAQGKSVDTRKLGLGLEEIYITSPQGEPAAH